MIDSYPAILLVTVAVEVAIAACWLGPSKPIDLLKIVVCANLLTHPVAYFCVLPFGFWPIETGVLLAEFAVYRWIGGLRARSAGLLALATNAATIALALLM